MGIKFWIIRFATVFIGSCLIIAVAQLLKGHETSYAATQGVVWGLIASTIFIAVRLYRSRRGERCELCNDTPNPPPTHGGQT